MFLLFDLDPFPKYVGFDWFFEDKFSPSKDVLEESRTQLNVRQSKFETQSLSLSHSRPEHTKLAFRRVIDSQSEDAH
jgi:hypothetical protein